MMMLKVSQGTFLRHANQQAKKLAYLGTNNKKWTSQIRGPYVYQNLRYFTQGDLQKKDETQNKEAQQPDHKIHSLDKNPYLAQAAQQKASKKEIYRHLYPMIFNKETKKILYSSTALLVASKVLSICSPYFLKIAVNALSNAQKLDINTAFMSIIAFGLARIFSTVFQEYRMNQIQQIMQIGLKNVALNSFNHLHTLDIYYHKISAKNTVFAIRKAISSIDNALRFSLGMFAPVAFEFFLLSGTIYFYFGLPYVTNMFLTLGIYTYYTKWYSSFRQGLIRKNKNNEKKSEFYLNDSIMNYETVKTFHNEKLEVQRYERLLNKIKDTAMQVQYTLARLNIGQTIIFSTGLTINLLLSAYGVQTGALTTGDFVMIQALFMQIGVPLNNMGTFFRQIDQSQVDVEDLYFLIKQKALVREIENPKTFEFKEGSIELRNIKFRHLLTSVNKERKKLVQINQLQEGALLFDDLNIKVKARTTNAIVGYSGFGKTTLLNLMTRLYDPDEGTVLIDGQDLKELSFESFRKYISVVPQNGILFNDTILFNLKYGNPDASQEEVVEMAKKCQIHDKIMKMENGYDTQVGDLGSKLSGGERQRILICRGLLKKDAQIYLFDEATSNLDSHIEKDLTDALQEQLKNKTVIYCAHRLSSIVNVDNILVMDNGHVAEQGTHWELMEREGSLYSQMWKDYLREQEKGKEGVLNHESGPSDTNNIQ